MTTFAEPIPKSNPMLPYKPLCKFKYYFSLNNWDGCLPVLSIIKNLIIISEQSKKWCDATIGTSFISLVYKLVTLKGNPLSVHSVYDNWSQIRFSL